MPQLTGGLTIKYTRFVVEQDGETLLDNCALNWKDEFEILRDIRKNFATQPVVSGTKKELIIRVSREVG